MPDVLPLMIGTAGHVDHGKTTLLNALLGDAPDTDRRPEEQARGLTIDIGYAEMEVGGRHVGIVDVPGHERFVRNMVAAASGIDLVLLVVAADDGVMPQTREHLEIADLLGATSGVVALTKTDLVDEELALAAEEEIRELIAGTFLTAAPIIHVSAVEGRGLPELREAVAEQLERACPRSARGVFRLPVQRSFTFAGHGTVVTGVPLAGRVRVGDTLEAMPGARKCRVRAIQAYHQDVEEARAGHRTALKLSDVSFRDVRRGTVIGEPGYLRGANLLEARFSLLPRRTRPLKSNESVRFHTGTSEVVGRIFLLSGRQIAPGESGLVQLRLDRPVVTAPGDRFVLRCPSPQVTLGGGIVIGESRRKISAGKSRLVKRVAEREAGLDDPERSVLFHLSASGLDPLGSRAVAREVYLRADEFGPLLDKLLAEGSILKVGARFLSAVQVDAGRTRLVRTLEKFHKKEPLRAAASAAWVREQLGVSDSVLDLLVSTGDAVESVPGGRLRIAGRAPALSPEQMERLESMKELVSKERFATPKEAELPGLLNIMAEEAAKLLDLLIHDGAIVRIGAGVILSAEATAEAKEKIADWIGKNGPLAPADLKTLLGMSRKYSIPLLEWLDATRFTVRKGDRRELG